MASKLVRPDDEVIDAMVARLRDTGTLIFVASTGAAGRLRQDLWGAPGSSANIVGDAFTYDRSLTEEFLGFEPKSFCSRLTALQLAAQAFAKARRKADTLPERQDVLGLGMTAAVATGRELRGGHRVHVAAKSNRQFYVVEATFEAGALTRREEGEACDLLALDLILRIKGCGGLDLPLHSSIRHQCVEEGFHIMCLPPLSQEIRPVEPVTLFDRSGNRDGCIGHSTETAALLERKGIGPETHVIFPGSFDPLHYGHEDIAAMMETMTDEGKKVIFQISGSHPAKGVLSDRVLLERAAQFRFRAPLLILKNAGLYVEKARLLPGFSFLVGADAVMGLMNPAYYGGREQRNRALDELQDLGAHFYVAGREIDGTFTSLDLIDMPSRYAGLFTHVSSRNDISSTRLRKRL